ncbi:MAG: M20/M25/M40 family metallo-hydrolase [Clostridia bacterium]|nr:M20/M25/M40 family metallo-hydrolase [Clostridia bacterium]
MVELLKKLMGTPGISGREEKIREVIISEARPYCDELTVDKMGNVIARKKGEGKRIMLCAHMDEIGFLVTHITDSGKIKVSNIGGINYLSAVFSEVVSEKGVTGVLVVDSSKEMPKPDSVYIDIGAKTRKQAEKRVSVGDFFVCAPKMKRLAGTKYVGRPFDDRIGCAILIKAMQEIKETKNDLYFVFSVQEEVGIRGSKPATYQISPDVGIAIDVTGVGDASASGVKLGGGCAIKIKDVSVISSPELVKKMRGLAKDNKVSYQDEILLAGGTDAGSMQITGKGAWAGGISIPTAHIHSGCEIIDMNDVKSALALTVLVAERL